MKNKVKFLTICLSIVMLAGCKEITVKTEPIAKTGPVVAEIASGENLITDEVLESNPKAKDVIAFHCYYHRDDGTEGGFSSTNYYVVIKDNNMCIYGVDHNTTASNGYTVKYEQSIDTESIDEIKRYVENESWKDLYDRIRVYANTIEGVVVSEGMDDKDSRKEDGTYLWEDEFYKKYSSFSEEEGGGLARLDTEADYEPQYIETMEYCKEEEAVLLTDYKQYLEKSGGCTDELFYPKELFDTHTLYYIKKSVNGGGAYYTVDEISYSDSEGEMVANVALTYHVNMIDTDVMGTRYIFIPIKKDVAKLIFDEEVIIHE